MARIARRGLAAWLVAAGTVGGIGGGDAIAHDHPGIASGMPAAAAGLAGVAGQDTVDHRATRRPLGEWSGGQVGASRLPARLDGESMLTRWIESEEAARVACDHALRAEAFDPIAAKPESHLPPLAASSGFDTRDASERIAEALASFRRLRMLMTRDDFAAKWLAPKAGIDAGDAFSLGNAGEVVSGRTESRNESRNVARGLADLACQEPVDVIPVVVRESAVVREPAVVNETPRVAKVATPAPDGVAVAASEPPRFGQIGLVGSAGIVATMADSYLPYDLSPEDAIAMRMYPISGVPISHQGGRRTGVYAPVDGLAGGTRWHHRIEPATVLSTPGAAHVAGVAHDAGVADSGAVVDQTENAVAAKDAEKMLATLARIVVEAAQPDSHQRHLLTPDRLGIRLGEWASIGWGAVDDSAIDLTERFAKALRPQMTESQPNGQPHSDGQRLVAGARLLTPHPVVSTDWEDVAMSDRAFRIEIACRAAIDGVIAQASRGGGGGGGESSLRQDTLAANSDAANSDAAAVDAEITRAEAVATACDQAAAMLERLAMSLRRAGDSVVRQAKAKPAAGGSIVR